MPENVISEPQAVVIGGGFFGLRTALYMREALGVHNIIILEKESSLMTRASYVNQARVHNGYHYPRSILTASRSAANFPKFIKEYEPAIVNDFDKYYALASKLSKVNARQFRSFCKKVGINIEPAPADIKRNFSSVLVEDVFKVKEHAFNSRLLEQLLRDRIAAYDDILIYTNQEVVRVRPAINDSKLAVDTKKQTFVASKVFNCAYSQLNHLHRQSKLPLLELKHEVAEMCLVELPQEFSNFSITVMDGPFFSIMPFPSRGLHTLSHVRYTPHISWQDNTDTPSKLRNPHRFIESYQMQTAYKKMLGDVSRYIPALSGMKLVDTISDIKTVLIKSEQDDSRPILFRSDFGLQGYNCIMGGKLDNIYDVFAELNHLYGKK